MTGSVYISFQMQVRFLLQNHLQFSKGIQLVIDSNITNATILTDSLSAINNIKNAHNINDINIQVQNLIQHGKEKGNPAQLCWIPGHSSIIENEMADKAANDAITNPLATVVQLITKHDLLPIIKLHCTIMWQARWNSVRTKLHEIKHDVFPWPHSSNLPRKFEVILTRLRIGHRTHPFNEQKRSSSMPNLWH